MYQIVYRTTAIKGLARMPVKQRRRIKYVLDMIAEDPRGYGGDWKALAGSPYWRLRVGGFRAICDVQDGRLTLLVLKADPRGDIYK